MDSKEIRLRCIEALTGMGVKAPEKIIKEAKTLEEWVLMAPPDKAPTPARKTRKTVDKD